MKKTILFFLLISSSISFSQGIWDFSGPSAQNWNDNDFNCTSTSLDENGDGVLDLAFTENKNNPYIENLNLGVTEVVAASKPILAITLKQKITGGPSHIRVTYPSDTDETKSITKSVNIDGDLTSYKTYYIDIGGNNWGVANTVSEDQLKLVFKATDNANYTSGTGNGVRITKIELLSEIPLPAIEIADTSFAIDNDNEEWITNQNGVSSVVNGALRINLIPNATPASNQMVKIDHIGTEPEGHDNDYESYVDADSKKFLYLLYKNIGVSTTDTTYNDNLRFQWKGDHFEGNVSVNKDIKQNMTESDEFELLKFDLSSKTEWSQNTKDFQFSVKNLSYQKSGFSKGTTTKGVFIIDRILFSNDGNLNNEEVLSYSSLLTNDLSIIVYPNPTSNLISIKNSSNKSINQVSIINILGHEILRTQKTSQLDVRSLKAGMYVLKLSFKDGSTTTKRFMKK